jgi:hypothetical protein
MYTNDFVYIMKYLHQEVVSDIWKDLHVGGIIQSFSRFGNGSHLPK